MACNIEDLEPSEIILGCTDPLALNYDENATVDTGLCVYSGQTSGCTDPSAINYSPDAIFEDCSCVYDLCPTGVTITNGIVYYNITTQTGDNTGVVITDPASGTIEENIAISGKKSLTGSKVPFQPILENLPVFENLPIPLGEDCCNSTVVGEEVFWDGEFCRLVEVRDECPDSLAISIDGILLNGETGQPVGAECCAQQEGYSFFQNLIIEPYTSGNGLCVKDEFTPEDPCDLALEDVIYVGDTVVYDSSTPPAVGSGSSGSGVGTGNLGGGVNVDPTLDCVELIQWTRGYVSDTDTDPQSGINDSVGTDVINPSTGISDYPLGTYLLVLNSTDPQALNLQVGDQIEISGIDGISGIPCYDETINNELNGLAKVTKLIGPDGNGVLRIVTDINITPYVLFGGGTNFCVVQDTTGIVCPVFVNDDGQTGSGGDTGGGTNTGGSTGGGDTGGGTNTGGTTGGGDNTAGCIQFTDFLFLSLDTANIIFGGPPYYLEYCNNYLQNQTGYEYYLFVKYDAVYDQFISECTDYALTNGFVNTILSSCWGQEVTYNDTGQGGQQITVTEQVEFPQNNVKIIKKGLFNGEYYALIDVSMSQNLGTALEQQCGQTFVSVTPVNGLGLNFQSGVFQLCTAGTGDYIGGSNLPTQGGSNKSANTYVNKKGEPTTVPITEPSLLPTGPALNPCEVEEGNPITPEEPTPDNNFENLSENCCLTLGADLGWEFIDGVCYWNPPTPTISTEFGLSENEILVEDLECTNLEINASFYLERPDDSACEPDGNDITASLVIYTGNSMSSTTIQTSVISTYSLNANGYCQWTDLSSTIVNDFTTPFKVKLVLDGVKDCCEYDIFVDDIQVNCVKQDAITVNNFNTCPGFNLKRVIDNKKSWTNNTEKVINRTFAPSPDADLPWRYTDYVKQSGVYERDSRLVLNSKEVDLIFNMRKKEKPCPVGYTYNPVNDTCFKNVLNCPDGYTLSGDTCYSGITTTSATTETVTISRNEDSCNLDLSIFDLLEYKKNFQNFWVKFIEQFIPATTIFVSGEKWSNRDNEICPTIEECGYDNIFTKSDLGLKSTDGGLTDVPNKNTNTQSPVFKSDEEVPSEKGGDYGSNKNEGPVILPGFTGSFIPKDPSILDDGPLTLKRGELELLNKGKNKYQPKISIFNS
jgi:hypothetical protein